MQELCISFERYEGKENRKKKIQDEIASLVTGICARKLFVLEYTRIEIHRAIDSLHGSQQTAL
jgi:hypothetical protein